MAADYRQCGFARWGRPVPADRPSANLHAATLSVLEASAQTVERSPSITRRASLLCPDRCQIGRRTMLSFRCRITGLLNKDTSPAAPRDRSGEGHGTPRPGDPPHEARRTAPQRTRAHGTATDHCRQKRQGDLYGHPRWNGVRRRRMVKGFFLNNTLTTSSLGPGLDGKPGAKCAGAGATAALGHVAHPRLRQGRQVPSVAGIERRARDYRLCLHKDWWQGWMAHDPAQAIALPRQRNPRPRPVEKARKMDALAPH